MWRFCQPVFLLRWLVLTVGLFDLVLPLFRTWVRVIRLVISMRSKCE